MSRTECTSDAAWAPRRSEDFASIATAKGVVGAQLRRWRAYIGVAASSIIHRTGTVRYSADVPEHITVYCRRPLEPGSLGRLSREPDYLTAAERAGLDDAAMATAIRGLVVTSSNAITYAGASRPIQVTHYADAAMVRTLVDEARARIDGDDHGAIATLLGEVVEVIDLELGLDQAEGIGGVIAEQLALAVAFETDGIVDFYGNEWRAI